MTPERAEFHRLMLQLGIRDKLDMEFELALEKEEPLSDLVLSLCTCISDDERVRDVLRTYTLDYSVNEQIVCDFIMEDMHERYQSGEFSRADVVRNLYAIVTYLQKFWNSPWDELIDISYDLELFEDGFITEDVFNRCFDAWFFEGKRLNAWKLMRE